MKAKKFDSLQNSQGKKKKTNQGKNIRRNKVHSRLNKMSSRHNKENHGGQNKPSKLLEGLQETVFCGKLFWSILKR